MLRICRDCGGEIDARNVVVVAEDAGRTAVDGGSLPGPPCEAADEEAPPQRRDRRGGTARVERSATATPVAPARARVERRKDDQFAGPGARVALSDRHEYVLALFKYGLVDSARDLAIVMNVAESVAQGMCDQLVDAGLLDGQRQENDLAAPLKETRRVERQSRRARRGDPRAT